MPEDKPGSQPGIQGGSEMIEFADTKETDFSSVVVWLTLCVALLFMGFIWFSNSSLKNSIAEKQNQKTEVQATLSLPENQKVVDDVTGLKKVISILSSVSSTQESKKVTLDNLYTHFTKDVRVSTVALSEDGTVGVDATTASYRTAADFMLGLKAYSRVSNLELKTISMSTDPKADPTQKVSFSVLFKLDMTKEPEKVAEVSSETDASVSETVPPVSDQGISPLGDTSIDSTLDSSTQQTP